MQDELLNRFWGFAFRTDIKIQHVIDRNFFFCAFDLFKSLAYFLDDYLNKALKYWLLKMI